MKARRFICVVSAIAVLTLCVAAHADKVTIVTATSTFTVDEFDLNASGQISDWTKPAGVDIRSATANPANGDIVWCMSDGSARVANYQSLGTTISSGTVGSGSALLCATARPNGDLYFGSIDGWVYARSRTNVTAAPSGYTQPANLNLGYAGSEYMYVNSSPLVDQVMIVGNDIGRVFMRQGNNMSATVGAWDGIEFGTSIWAQATLSTGDVVLATRAGNPSNYVYVRDNADLSAAPAGYVDHAILGYGTRPNAIATKVVNGVDYLVIGNDSGQLFVRKASDLTETVIPGFTSTSSDYMNDIDGIRSLAITSNNNVVIGLYNGQIHVRSLFDIDGDDIGMTYRYTQSGGIVGVYAVPEPMTITLLAGGLIGLLRRR